MTWLAYLRVGIVAAMTGAVAGASVPGPSPSAPSPFKVSFQDDADVSRLLVCERTSQAELHCLDLGRFMTAVEAEKEHARERQDAQMQRDADWNGVDL